jgi:hypothetical protein
MKPHTLPCAVLLMFATGLSPARAVENSPTNFRDAYAQLLPLFPADAQGRGLDRGDETRKPADQPMTYGLILSAESLRFRIAPTGEGQRRVRQAARWLINNRDLDGDGKPGWGLPHAWGIHPRNCPYTITTAIVLDGLLDALALPKFWSDSERAEILGLARAVVMRWCRELWAAGYGGGFFVYSPHEEGPPSFNVNAAANFLSPLARLNHEHPSALTIEAKNLFAACIDSLVKATVAQATMRDGAPFWRYVAVPNAIKSDRGNDLIHQAYILWGLETFRDCGGTLPWSRANALESLRRNWKGDRLCFYPMDEPNMKPGNREAPANLWGAGMLLAFEGRWGSATEAARCFAAITKSYGPFPRVRVLPIEVSDDGEFYARDAAHVLFGLAHAAFRE